MPDARRRRSISPFISMIYYRAISLILISPRRRRHFTLLLAPAGAFSARGV